MVIMPLDDPTQFAQFVVNGLGECGRSGMDSFDSPPMGSYDAPMTLYMVYL